MVEESGFTVVLGKVEREAAVNLGVLVFRKAAGSIGASGGELYESFVI